MFWCKFGEDVCNSQDEPVTACSFVWKLEARVGSEKVSMFAKRTFNVTNLFFLDSDWSGHSSKCAFVGWIFACWLCGHVFKCCKHVAMHFIVNVENLIQVMALMRSFFHFSPFCMSGVCWRYPHRNRQDNVKFLTTLECLGGYQCIRMSLVVSVLSNLPQAAFQEFSDRIHADHRWIWAQLRYCDNSDCDKWWQPFYWLKF